LVSKAKRKNTKRRSILVKRVRRRKRILLKSSASIAMSLGIMLLNVLIGIR